MDVAEKLAILAPAAHYEACDTHAVAGRRYQSTKAHWSENALSAEADAKGVRRPVMRLLMSAECVHNCPYCPLRAGGDVPRATLTPDEAAAVCGKIREAISAEHGPEVADATRILYGGSVKANNVAGFLRSSEVDGVLVGGASLDADEFSGIARFQKHIAL
jgi:hypothetical protein